jgi:hypothetical protein
MRHQPVGGERVRAGGDFLPTLGEYADRGRCAGWGHLLPGLCPDKLSAIRAKVQPASAGHQVSN